MRIAVVYDCLYPFTVGGAERWYRNLAQRLAERHQVTYVTRRQWSGDRTPEGPAGVEVVAVSGGRTLYTASGRRNIAVPVRFGFGVLWHLLRHRRRYDIVHTCAFPYFSVIAARLACAFGGPPVVVDWHEVWTERYWRQYLGPIAGLIGTIIQRLCVRLSGTVFVFSQLHADRLRQEGYRGEPIVLTGEYAGSTQVLDSVSRRGPTVVFVGRHIREKRVTVVPAAIARARECIPTLQATIFGDGPERSLVMAEVERLGLCAVITCPGFVPWEEVDTAMRNAMCLLLPSQREGYGLVVVEAAARGTPVIVVRDPDNAAAELVSEGQNGSIVERADPDALAAAIVGVHAAGPALVERTRKWFKDNAQRLSVDASVAQIEAAYAAVIGCQSLGPGPLRNHEGDVGGGASGAHVGSASTNR
jgi:glycosyltransferase involved in cell wall biosynthesis